MNKNLIVINKLGDEFLFFSIMIKEEAEILYIGKHNRKIQDYLKKLVSLDLIKGFKIKNTMVKKLHKNGDQFYKYIEDFDAVYTYGINGTKAQDNIIKCLFTFDININLLSLNDYPQNIVKLTESEYYLKYNLMVNLEIQPKGNFVEAYSKYTKKDIEIYYKKKYKHTITDCNRSTYIIDAQYAILRVLKKYKLKKVLLYNLDQNVISSRVDIDDIQIETKSNAICDVTICNKPINPKKIKTKYVIAVNSTLDNNFRPIEKDYINPILEKLCEDDYKSNINYARKRMEIILYEKK